MTINQAAVYEWPTTLLIIVLVCQLLAIAAPWLIPTNPLGKWRLYHPALAATLLWLAYEITLVILYSGTGPLIRVDFVFLLLPLFVIDWLIALLACAFRRRS